MFLFRLVDALKDRDIVAVAFVKISRFVCMSACYKVRQGTPIVIAEFGSSGITQNASLLVTKVTVEIVVGDERVVAFIVEEAVFVLRECAATTQSQSDTQQAGPSEHGTRAAKTSYSYQG